jgi:integrase
MASIRKRGDRWQAEVVKGALRTAKTFRQKKSAEAWARQIETDIENGLLGKTPNKTFGDLLDRYQREVSPGKRGALFEHHRINAVLRDPIAQIKLADLSRADFAAWRDRRLQSIADSSVRREWTILRSAVTTAINDWGWLSTNPMQGVRLPPPGKPRTRIFQESEISLILHALGYHEPPSTVSARVGTALLFALETAMRAGEICSLEWDQVDTRRRIAHLLKTKNGDQREVPLSPEACRLIETLRPETGASRLVFGGLTGNSIDALFRKARGRAGVEGVRFHDSRATAITRLSKVLDVLSLARMVGHRDIRQLMTYYRESAEDIAKRLPASPSCIIPDP